MLKSKFIPWAKAIAQINEKTETTVEGLVRKQAEITNKNCQSLVDLMFVECDKKSKAEFWKASKESIDLFVTTAWNDESKRNNYKTSLKIAFVYGLAFNVSLFKTHSAKDGQPKGEKESSPKAGAVPVVTPESAEKTARKLIFQMRALKKDDIAGALLDVMMEFNPEFTEAEPAK